MPAEALGLALAAAFYPPAIVALIAVVRGPMARRRVFVYLAGAATMTFAAGFAMMALLDGTGATKASHPDPSAGVDIALGALSLVAAAVVWRRAPVAVSASRPEDGVAVPGKPSRTERFTRRAALVFVLGFAMYAPSPLYVGAVKIVADQNLSAGANAVAVLVLGALVLLMVEIPALLVLLRPESGLQLLERANHWLRDNARLLGALVFAGGGAYLIARGIADLLG